MAKESVAAKKHKEIGPKTVTAAIITVSDTRTPRTDESGGAIRAALQEKGHKVLRYAVCPDEPPRISQELGSSLATGCDVVIINGGTGIAQRDVTIETVSLHLEKKLEGFGEIFRQLSYKEIGSSAMLSRAVAGTYQGAMVFCLPGSPEAVRLAMDKLILPELGHIVGLIKGHRMPR